MKHPHQRHLPAVTNLHTFEVVARLSSMTAAAQELGLTQSAVSRQLLDLEAFVGAQLLARSSTGLSLTPAGSGYLRRVRLILEDLEAASITVSMSSLPSKSLRLSVPTTLGALWLVPKLCEFSVRNPDIQIDIANHTGPLSVHRSEFDAAVVYGEGPEQGCHGHLLYPMLGMAVGAPGLSRLPRPLSPDQLAELPLLHQTTSPNSWPAFLRELGATTVRVPLPGPRYELLTMALSAAQAGMGLAILPAYVCGPALADGSLERYAEPIFRSPRSYYLIIPADRPPSSAMVRLRDWLLAAAAAENPLGNHVA